MSSSRGGKNKPKNGRRSNASVKVVNEEVERFLTLVEARSFIYDLKDKLHTDRDMLKLAWEEIGESLNITAEEAKKKYESLRGAYTKAKNNTAPSGSVRSRKSAETLRQEAEFMKRMAFMDRFISTRRTTDNYSNSDESEEEEEQESPKNTSSTAEGVSSDEMDENNPADAITSPSSSLSSTKKRNKRAKYEKEDAMKRLLNVIEKPDDEEEIFALSVASTLKRFSPRKRSLAKLKIQTVLHEITVAPETQHDAAAQPVYTGHPQTLEKVLTFSEL